MTDYNHSGNAVITTISSGINGSDTTITIASSTGWPSSTFWATLVDALDLSERTKEERILLDSRSGTTLTVNASGRGADGTSAQTWSSGSYIFHGPAAAEFEDYSNHLANTSLHLGTGTISSSAYFAAGVVDSAAIATDAVDTAEIKASAVGASELATDAVTTAKILDSNVTTAKINNLAVTTAKIAADAVDGTKIADDSIDSEHITDGAIDTAHIGDLQVTTGKIAADAVDGTKIADDSIDSEHIADGAIDTAHIADSQVTTGKLATKAVTAAKVGVLPACRIKRSSNQSITGGASGAAIQFNDTDDYDTDTMHDTSSSNTRITFNTAGIYRITATCTWAVAASPDASGSLGINLKLNGTTTIHTGQTQEESVDNKVRSLAVTEYAFAANDYIEAIAVFNDTNSSPTSLNVEAATATASFICPAS